MHFSDVKSVCVCVCVCVCLFRPMLCSVPLCCTGKHVWGENEDMSFCGLFGVSKPHAFSDT